MNKKSPHFSMILEILMISLKFTSLIIILRIKEFRLLLKVDNHLLNLLIKFNFSTSNKCPNEVNWKTPLPLRVLLFGCKVLKNVISVKVFLNEKLSNISKLAPYM